MKSLDANETHVIWSADLAPCLRIMPGDTIEVQTSLGSGARYLQSATPDDIREVTAISPGLSLTGPIFVEGAEPGDVLGIELCAIGIAPWGYTTVAPGFGLLTDEFPEPAFEAGIFRWATPPVSTTISPCSCVLFLGGRGGTAAWTGCRRPFHQPGGGETSIFRRFTARSTLFLPVATEGALLSVGDAHGAQGDGEVCGSAIETSARAALRITLHKGCPLTYPALRTHSSGPDLGGEGAYITTGVGPDLYAAAQDAVRGLIAWLVSQCGLSRVEAYMLCSVCLELAISEVVDRPNWVVSAAMPLAIFGQSKPASS